MWDRRTGEPLHRAIVWQDRRTAERCDELRDAGHLDLVRSRTGLVLDPYFSATKLEWILRSGASTPPPMLAFGTVDSWLLWKLTGGAVHATDASNASRTMLYDIGALDWSDELLALFSVPRSMLPEVRPSSGEIGTTVATEGIPAGIPIAGIAGDQQAALFGQACFEPGMSKNTYGTGSFVLMNVGRRCSRPRRGPAHHGRAGRSPTARVPTRSRARSSSPEPRSSGCETASVSSKPPPRSAPSPSRARTPRACTSSRPSPASAARTGIPTRAAPSSVSRGGRAARTSRAPSSRR